MSTEDIELLPLGGLDPKDPKARGAHADVERTEEAFTVSSLLTVAVLASLPTVLTEAEAGTIASQVDDRESRYTLIMSIVCLICSDDPVLTKRLLSWRPQSSSEDSRVPGVGGSSLRSPIYHPRTDSFAMPTIQAPRRPGGQNLHSRP